jgi:hypothetical protein
LTIDAGWPGMQRDAADLLARVVATTNEAPLVVSLADR